VTTRELLEAFADGRASRDELEHGLAGLVTIQFCGKERSVTVSPQLKDEVVIRPEHVRARMQAYLRGDISADHLSEWASLILLIGAYNWLGSQFLESSPGERAWLVIQELSLPEVHGPISHASVNEKLDRLKKKGNREPAA
jgi:hypothetical protein